MYALVQCILANGFEELHAKTTHHTHTHTNTHTQTHAPSDVVLEVGAPVRDHVEVM